MSNQPTTQQRLAKLEMEYRDLLEEVRNNTELTAQIARDTQELVSLFNTMKTGVKIVSTVGGIVKWIGSIAAAIGAVWVLYTHSGKGG